MGCQGSNVAGLETTATFDEKTDEFIIHTPTISATKWWIGGAAHSATHCSVFARLIVKGKDYGTKTFIVPLRDPRSYALLPGINIGDIGKKMGRDGIGALASSCSGRSLSSDGLRTDQTTATSSSPMSGSPALSCS